MDNRIKTLLDSLRVAEAAEMQDLAPDATENPFFCRLEDDCFSDRISSRDRKTLRTVSSPGKPLGRKADHNRVFSSEPASLPHWSATSTFGFVTVVGVTSSKTAFAGEVAPGGVMTRKILLQGEVVPPIVHPDGITPNPVVSIE